MFWHQTYSTCAVLAAELLLAAGAAAFPCRTDFGLVEVPPASGYVPGDNTVRKVIQRTKKAIGGQNGKVVSVLILESEAPSSHGHANGYSELISLSQTSIEAPVSDDDFRKIAGVTREQILSLESQPVKGLKFSDFREGPDFYCNTLEIHLDGGEGGASAFTVMGGVHIGGHLYSVVSHTAAARDAAARTAWLGKSVAWIESLVAANRAPHAAGAAPQISTVPNIDDYSIAGITFENTSRARTKGRLGPDCLDIRIDYPRSMDETAPPPGALLAFERLIDNFAFRLEVGETRIDADLDADLDAFAAASPEAAQAAAAALADRLAQADAPGSSSPAISSGILEIAKRRAVWRDSWRPAAPGDTASGPATKTLWLQADGLRALRVEFSLRDTITPLIPMADLAHLNGVMSKTATSVSIQNKRQFKKR